MSDQLGTGVPHRTITEAQLADILREWIDTNPLVTPEQMAKRLLWTLPDHGTTTDCPIKGVHDHPFRGPHRFHEWDPDAALPDTGLRWEPLPNDCRRHEGPHESHYCNGAVGRWVPDTGLERLVAFGMMIAEDPSAVWASGDARGYVRRLAERYARLTSSPTAEEDPSDPEHAWRGTADEWRHDR